MICFSAFWLSLAKERLGEEFEVDIYDKETYIGGSKYTLLLLLIIAYSL